MTLLQASFEVSPAGTAIPTTAGPDGFAVGSDGSGTTFVSDATAGAVASGTLAGKITIPGTAAQSYRGWNWSGGVVHGRLYVYLTAYPNGNGVAVWENRNGSTSLSRCRINSSGTVGVGVGTATPAYTTGVLPLNTLCRIEFSFSHAAGTMSLDIYVGNSTTPISGGTVSQSGLSFAAASVTSVRAGIVSGVTNFTFRTDAWALSDTGRVGPAVTGGTIAGATAVATARADAGSVGAVVGTTVTIAGVTAVVVAEGGVRPVPPAPPANDPLWPPDPYREAIRSGSYALAYTVDATLDGVPVEGATGLRPTGGTITDTTKPGVRRVLNLNLAPEPGLFDRLAPVGTTLTVTARVTYLNRATQDIPMGVFDIDSEKLSEGGGGLSLTAPDKWVKIQRARFIGPTASTPGMLVVDQIAALIKGALGSDERVAVSATSRALVGALTWERHRDKAIIDLATSIGAWVYFDRNGLATIADTPTAGPSADWLIDASPSGVLVELDRERSRGNTYNVVVVESSSTDNPFTMQYVWDSDVASPTYAGTNPFTNPETAGPFGIVTYYHDTPLPLGNEGAYRTAQTILSRVVGRASQVSLGAAPNPALDAFDVLDVLAPKERYDIPRALERHVADTVTHPLTLGSVQQIEGRSTRTDEYT